MRQRKVSFIVEVGIVVECNLWRNGYEEYE